MCLLPGALSTFWDGWCFLSLCLYKQFLLLNCIPQYSHWNLRGALGRGTESAGGDSVALSAGREVGDVGSLVL